jgi:hypothetical protein
MYAAYWVIIVLPNPLTRYTTIGGAGRVEQVHYQGRLGVKRRDRWNWRVASNADGHLCRSCARILCCFGHIRHLVGPWGCSRRWLGTGRATGLSTDMLQCLGSTGEGCWFHQEARSGLPRVLQRAEWTWIGMYMSRQVYVSLKANVDRQIAV